MLKKFLATVLLSALLIPSAFASSSHPSLAEIAAFLGMTETELVTELNSGLTMEQVAAEQGINKEDLRDFLNRSPDSAFSQLLLDEDFVAGLADILNMTSEQLLSELAAGKTPKQLADQQGVMMVLVKGYLKTAVEEYNATH